MEQNNFNSQNEREQTGFNAEPSHKEESVFAGAKHVASAMKSATVKKSKKKPLVIAVVCLVVTAVLLIGGYFAYKHFAKDSVNKNVPTSTNDNLQTKDAKDANKAEQNKETAQVTVIELYPDRKVNKKDLEKFMAIIDERAKILGDAYQLNVDESKITLTIEKDLLGTTAGERNDTLKMLISRGNLCFGTPYYLDTQNDIKGFVFKSKIANLDAKTILAEYSDNMLEEKYSQLEAVKDKNIYALELTLNNSGIDHLNFLSDDAPQDSVIIAAHGFETNEYNDSYNFFGSVLLKNKDASAVYIVSPTPTYPKTAELMKVIIDQEEMNFGLKESIADEPNWQTDESEMGKNQVATMDENSIITLFTPDEFSRSYNTEDDFLNYEATVKSRLEKLGIKYMFGTSGFDDKTYCVKLSASDVGPDFFRLIFGKGEVMVNSAFDTLYSMYDPELIKTNGKYAIRMYSYSSPDEILSETNIPNNIVYLVANDVTIASADITTMTEEDGKYYLYFENFLCFGDTEVTKKEEKALDLICSVNNDNYTPVEGTFVFRASSNKETLDSFNWKYEPLTSEDTRVFDIVTSMGHDIEKTVDSRNNITITINLKVTPSLPQDFVNNIKEVYTACNFDTGAYNKISFVIKDESVDSPADKFRFEVEKDTFDGKMEIDEEISGPKFFDYWSDMYDIISGDTFFTERSRY